MTWETFEHWGNRAQIILALGGYIGWAYTLWPSGAVLLGSPKNLNWQALFAASLVVVGLVSTAAHVMPLLRQRRAHSEAALTQPHVLEVSHAKGSQREPDFESFRGLVPVLERNYIQREQPPRGQPLPSDWLSDEILQLQHELRGRELDLASLDGPQVEERIVETSQLDFIRYKTRLTSAWDKGGWEFRNFESVFNVLLTTWGNVERVKNSDQKIVGGQFMTPQVLESAQEQMRKTADGFRVSLIPVSQLLANLRFKE